MVKPLEGYILVKPHIFKGPFVSEKENLGEDQFSEVLEVGPDTTDDNGNLRTTSVKKGQIIVHRESNKDFSLDHQLYRFVHFVEIHGIYIEDKKE